MHYRRVLRVLHEVNALTEEEYNWQVRKLDKERSEFIGKCFKAVLRAIVLSLLLLCVLHTFSDVLVYLDALLV